MLAVGTCGDVNGPSPQDEVAAFQAEEAQRLWSHLQGGIMNVLVAFAEAMMAAQLLERTAAVVVTAGDLDALDTLAPEEGDRLFHDAFTRSTLGGLKDQSPLARNDELRERLIHAWDVRNRIAHRFFLENIAGLSDADAHDELVEELSESAALFQEVAASVGEIGYSLARERGVEAEHLLLFGGVAQILMMRNPRPFDSLDLWDRTDGEEFLHQVALAMGIDVEALEEE